MHNGLLPLLGSAGAKRRTTPPVCPLLWGAGGLKHPSYDHTSGVSTVVTRATASQPTHQSGSDSRR